MLVRVKEDKKKDDKIIIVNLYQGQYNYCILFYAIRLQFYQVLELLELLESLRK